MRDSIAGTWLYGVMIVFMVIFIAYVSIFIAYNNVFKLKTTALTLIEKNSGFDQNVKDRIEQKLIDNNYGAKSYCTGMVGKVISNGSQKEVDGLLIDGDKNIVQVLGINIGSAPELIYSSSNDSSVDNLRKDKYNYCVTRSIKNWDTDVLYYYYVEFFLPFQLPVIGNFLNLKIDGESNHIQYKNDSFFPNPTVNNASSLTDSAPSVWAEVTKDNGNKIKFTFNDDVKLSAYAFAESGHEPTRWYVISDSAYTYTLSYTLQKNGTDSPSGFVNEGIGTWYRTGTFDIWVKDSSGKTNSRSVTVLQTDFYDKTSTYIYTGLRKSSQDSGDNSVYALRLSVESTGITDPIEKCKLINNKIVTKKVSSSSVLIDYPTLYCNLYLQNCSESIIQDIKTKFNDIHAESEEQKLNAYSDIMLQRDEAKQVCNQQLVN